MPIKVFHEEFLRQRVDLVSLDKLPPKFIKSSYLSDIFFLDMYVTLFTETFDFCYQKKVCWYGKLETGSPK